ncbi:hypothetical protein [Prevotella sp. OH937_COT-195]|uniref:hypothetical protein n=1 Tax=Prevotella sp. OH937_COT-195 TaxID=2491051 RepID=UPI000F64BAFF|nr:hypothetical protein [Prevotella sp. OH937_COT-195]RRC97663.1 hypothetical protein EII32_10230 [Prevotella sp. OH937_COT-195]
MFDCWADVQPFNRSRSGLRQDEMAAQMAASGLKQPGSVTCDSKSKQMRSNDRFGFDGFGSV